MEFPLGSSTKDSIIRALGARWPLAAIKIWHVLQKENQNVSYKAVYKALQELIEEKRIEKIDGEYKLNEQWLMTNVSEAQAILGKYRGKDITELQSEIKLTVFKFSDEFYRILANLIRDSDEIRLASKTPALFIKSESTGSSLRQQYVKTLFEAIKNGKNIYYLFSTDLALELIKKQKDKEALQKLRTLAPYSNLLLKHAPLHAVVTQAITKKTAIFGLASPSHTDLVGFIKIDGKNLSELIQLYDLVFANARPVKEFIELAQKS